MTTLQVIKNHFPYYIKKLDLEISEVNDGPAHTKIPAVAATAMRMKDDIRKAEATLDSVTRQRSQAMDANTWVAVGTL